jgi:hypothetical protein
MRAGDPLELSPRPPLSLWQQSLVMAAGVGWTKLLFINDLVLARLEWFDFFFDIEAATAALLLEIKA